MSCKLDVIGGLTNVQESTELQLAVSRYGQVECCFIPPPDLRDFEPGLVVFQESQSVQAVVKACGEGKVTVRGQPLCCEPHQPRGTASSTEAKGSHWGHFKDAAYAANSKRRKLPPQHQSDSRSCTPRVAPQEDRPGKVGSRLFGELGEERRTSSKGKNSIYRFIKSEDLPKRMKDMGLDVFVLGPQRISYLAAGTKVSFILREQEGTGKPQADEIEECWWQQKSHSAGTGPPRGRGPRAKQGARQAGGKDPRLERFIELNHLDAEVSKELMNEHESLQAAVIDRWEETGLKIDQSGDRQIPISAIVMDKLRTERERIWQRTKATASSTSRRSASRSSARRSRSEDSATRSPSPGGADNDGVAGNMEATNGATESAHETHQQKQLRPGCLRSRSRSRGSASRSLTPLKRDSALQDQASGTLQALQDEAGGSHLIQVTNLPSINKGMALSHYLADMLAPHLKELPDFNSQLGSPILQTWEEGQGTVFMKLQSADLAVSAARATDGLNLFGCCMKVRTVSKEEAEHLQGVEDNMPTRKVMLRAAT
eukprot:TRINITY_DN10860_c0_g4_i1.p1 TRINITY_DN10860_c0_g4~~TRINITY_DN10860_c0_g4_i1.p1  ORF type:complete len:543 (-),score=94.92 TRINITY_DN10860_c0_g4_i1:142-1770(-)